MGLYTKAVGALIGFNGQVVAVIWGSFMASEWLEERGMPGWWSRLLWTVCIVLILHSYYAFFRYLAMMEKGYRSFLRGSDTGKKHK